MKTEILISLVLIIGVVIGLCIVDTRLKQQQQLNEITEQLDTIEYRINEIEYHITVN